MPIKKEDDKKQFLDSVLNKFRCLANTEQVLNEILLSKSNTQELIWQRNAAFSMNGNMSNSDLTHSSCPC